MSTMAMVWVNQLSVPPPPPPPAAPPAVPPPVPAYTPPPPRRGMNWLWWLVGCGCLILILVIAGAIYGGKTLWQRAIVPELQKQQTPQPPPPTTDGGLKPTTIDEPVKIPSTTGAGQKPGSQAALQTALALANDDKWVGKVNSYTANWQRVTVWIGPPQSEYLSSVALKWDQRKNSYIVENTQQIPEE